MAAPRQHNGGRDRSGAVVAVLAGFLVTAAAIAGFAIVFPDVVGDLNLGSDEDTSTTSTTEAPPAGSPEEAAEVASTFAAALGTGDFSDVIFSDGLTSAVTTTTEASPDGSDGSPPASGADTTAPPAESQAPQQFADVVDAMAPFTLAATSGDVSITGPDRAQAPIAVTWTLAAGAEWLTESEIDLLMVDGQWTVDWDPSVLEPSLRPGDRLVQRRLSAPRAEILGRNGEVLVETLQVVDIGIQPGRVEDLPSLTQRLAELVPEVDPAELSARVAEAEPGDFVEVASLPQTDYDLIRDDVFPLPGTVFRESVRPVETEPDLARAIIGRSGPVTAEIVEEFPGLYEAGDFVGLSGIQGTYNEILTGRPGLEVIAVRARPIPGSTTEGSGLITTSSVVEAGQTEMLFTVPAEPGQTVQLTIDPDLQRAAEAALDQVPEAQQTSALVAIQVSTGDIVALANGPRGSTVNLAATGRYEPGSIFKVITSYAALVRGVDPNDTVDCPGQVLVNGQPIGNAGGNAFGTITLERALEVSCNTAFVNVSAGFDPEVLNATAAEMGIGVDYAIGIDVFSGSVPVATNANELAQASFGQGQVLFSPVAAAVMAASAAGGGYRPPRLVLTPAPDASGGTALEPGAADDLRDMMRSVVTNGTAGAAAGVAGGPVAGKTGTAQFGTGVPLPTHGWFVGFQGDLAFAVFIELGTSGNATPRAADFLNLIAP